jgi:hypothetical protein
MPFLTVSTNGGGIEPPAYLHKRLDITDQFRLDISYCGWSELQRLVESYSVFIKTEVPQSQVGGGL